MYQYMYNHYQYPYYDHHCDYDYRCWRRRKRHWNTHYYPYRLVDWDRYRHYDYW